MKSFGIAASAALTLAALGCGDEKFTAVRPQIEVPDTRINVGEVPVLNLRTANVRVTNLGRADLTVEKVSIKEAGTPFTVEAAPQQVASGEETGVVVGFKPPKQEDYTATLVIESDDPDRPVIEVALEGKGSTVAKVVADDKLDFLMVCENTGDIKRLKIQSTGTADLIIEGLEFKEGTAPEFTFVSSTKTPATVEKGTEILVSVKYTPVETSPDESSGTIVLRTTDPEHLEVEVPLHGKVNRAPIATIKDPPNGAPGATIEFDGSDSRDPDNHLPLQFAWSIKASPIGSKAQPTPKDTPKTSLTLDLPGQYTVSLKVKDALGCFSQPAFKDILAKPSQQLVIEMVWDNHDTDMDLHLVNEGEEFFGTRDCYYAEGHRTPDWGVLGDASDDPSLDRDDLTGFGPELIGYRAPPTGKFRVGVNFYSDHRSLNPATNVTIRVYEFGVVKSETRKKLTRAGQFWDVLIIDWPSGGITPVDQVKG